MVVNKRKGKSNPLTELQNEIDHVVSHLYSNLPTDIDPKYEQAINDIDFSKNNLTQDDIKKIDYNTWRVKIAKNMYCNHYYYHTLQYKDNAPRPMGMPSTLDYTIEQVRKLFEYPKMYNIDYECVEKGFKHHVANYVTLLKRIEKIHKGRHDLRHMRRIDELQYRHGIDKFDPPKHVYYSLREFYHDCGCSYGTTWKGNDHDNLYGINRFVDNIKDYDFGEWYRESDWVDNLPVRLFGNIDRMYNIQLNTMFKKWYKNGKYLLYAVLPQEDLQAVNLTMGDFCHFEIYHNRLKLLQSLVSHDHDDSNYKHNYNYDILSKYVWIALNDCSRYCTDELYRQQKFCAGEMDIFDCVLIKWLFTSNTKATWVRRNKHNYKSQYE